MKRFTITALEMLVRQHNHKLAHRLREEKDAEFKKHQSQPMPPKVRDLLAEIKKLGDKSNGLQGEWDLIRQRIMKEQEEIKIEIDKLRSKIGEAGWCLTRETSDYAHAKVVPHYPADYGQHVTDEVLQNHSDYLDLGKVVLTFEHGNDDDRRKVLVRMGVLDADSPKE